MAVSNELGIVQYMHCGKCVKEYKEGRFPGESPASASRLSVGFTKEGIQVWCQRHDCNVVHIDFQGERHPANLTAAPIRTPDNDQ